MSIHCNDAPRMRAYTSPVDFMSKRFERLAGCYLYFFPNIAYN